MGPFVAVIVPRSALKYHIWHYFPELALMSDLTIIVFLNTKFLLRLLLALLAKHCRVQLVVRLIGHQH